MVLFNYAVREITAKIVYYGPGLGGKTTNLQMIHESLDQKSRGRLISLATDADRTLFFDFLPLDLGQIGGYRLRYQLYTVPGQVHYNATRKLVLKGVDAVVFVADSQIEMIERNRESYDNLKENLTENGYDPDNMPVVFQFNKQDLPNVATPEEIATSLEIDISKIAYFETVATEGKGVFDCLKAIIKDSVARLRRQFEEGQIIESKKEEKSQAAALIMEEVEKPVEEEVKPVFPEDESVAEPSAETEEIAVEEAGALEGMEEPAKEIPIPEEDAFAMEEPFAAEEEPVVEAVGVNSLSEELPLPEEEEAKMEEAAVLSEKETAFQEEETVTEGAADMNEVDLETMLNEEIPETEPEVEVVSLQEGTEAVGEGKEEITFQAAEIEKASGEDERSETDELTVVDLSSQEEKEVPEIEPFETETQETDTFTIVDEVALDETGVSTASEGEKLETEDVSAEGETLLEETVEIAGSSKESYMEGGLEDFQTIPSGDLEEPEVVMEQTDEAQPVEEEEPMEESLKDEAPYQEEIPETPGLRLEKPSIEQLTDDLDSVRMKADRLEKSLVEIKESLNENREVMNKVIDIAMGKVIGKDEDQTGQGKSSPKQAGRKRRGFFRRLFGGKREE